jgi:hypothetical protein
MTTKRPLIVGFLLAIVLVGYGCASMQQPKGTVVPITKENLASLAGVWNGWAYAGANGFPGELTLRQDGYFNNSVGAFTSTGTFQIQNGSLVANPYVSGGLNNSNANITVQLMERSNGQRYLSGTGTSNGGPYSFEYNKR